MNIAINNRTDTTGMFQNVQIRNFEQKKTAETDSSSSETSYDAVSSQGDTLSVSAAGRNAESDGRVTEKAVSDTADPAAENSTINLSTYTETELKQMYLDGDITKAEYDGELENRELTG